MMSTAGTGSAKDLHDSNTLASEDGQRQPNEATRTSAATSPVESEKKSDESIITQASPGSKIQKLFHWIVWFLLDQWFLLGLGLVVLIASQVQVPARMQKTKEVVVTYLTVSIVFFVTGCTLSTRALIENYTRWVLHIFIQVQCFLMTSATTFGIVSACATNKEFMDPWLLIGLIVVGCVPTTISSNVVMTREAHGNQALTVVQSTIGNFLGPFLSPLLLSMYTSTGAWYSKVLPADTGGYEEIYRRVFKQLGLSIFLPMVIGQIVQNIFPKTTSKIFNEWKLSKLGSVSLLILIWQTFDQAFQTGAFSSVKGDNMIFIVFISIGLWLLWFSICVLSSWLWLPKADIIAIAYIVPGKGPAFAVPLTTVLYVGISRIEESKIQIPIVIFQGFQIAAGSLMTMAFRRWVQKGNPKQPTNEIAEEQ